MKAGLWNYYRYRGSGLVHAGWRGRQARCREGGGVRLLATPPLLLLLIRSQESGCLRTAVDPSVTM